MPADYEHSRNQPAQDRVPSWETAGLPRSETAGSPGGETAGLPRSEVPDWYADDPADDGSAQRAAFAEGGWADTLAPDPLLATLVDLVQRDGLDKLDDDQLTGVLQAANRLMAWSASVRVAAVSGLVGRRETAGRETGDWRPVDHADDEVAVALTLTRRSAGRLLDLALGLDRLPLTRAALAAGLIDERRAEVIVEEVSELDDEHAAAVEKLIIGRAPGLTSGQLRALVRRAVLSADPQAARRRKEKALKDARVEMFPETSGTAALAGRDLPPAAVLAADKHLTALAQAMKAAEQPGTLDILRAWAYLHLLSGQPAATLIPGTSAPGDVSSQPPGGAGREPPGGTGPHEAPRGPDAGTRFPAASGDIPGPGEPGTTWPGPGGLPATPGLPGLRGTVNLTMPLPAWLGWTQAPGDVPGYGPVDAEDSRTLAGLLAYRPGNQWCVTLTDPAGHPVAHACARHGPPGPPGAPPPHPREPTPATPVPDWLRGLTFTTLRTTTCTHPRESRGYQPAASLRHLIQIRNPTCTSPGCRQPATRCDLDHVTPYDRGGRTCDCNMHPLCRWHHRAKQTYGWRLEQPQPGVLVWTTPSGRAYTTTPTCYPTG